MQRYWLVIHLSGKGRALVAAHNISKRTVILTEKPLKIIQADFGTTGVIPTKGKGAIQKQLANKFRSLNNADRQFLEGLFASPENASKWGN